MITIARHHVRRHRHVFRHATLGLPRRGPVPPLLITDDGSRLRAHCRYGGLGVEHLQDDSDSPPGAVALPLDTLAEVEGGNETPVTITPAAPDGVVHR